MVAGNEDRHFRRLTEAVEDSYRDQRVDREAHKFIVKHLAGEYYPTRFGEGGIETTVNLLGMATRAMSRHLISKAPRVLATPNSGKYKSLAEDAEFSANRRIQKSHLDRVLRDCVSQSMVSFGTFFMGAEYVGTNEGMKLELVMDSIDRANYVYDIRSSTLEMADFQGHKFEMPLIDLRDHPLFDEEAKAKVEANGHSSGPDDEDQNLRSPPGNGRRGLYDYVELFCIYDRRRNALFYYPRYQSDILLLEIPWNGPEGGPYRYLYYEKLAGQAIPISPCMNLLKKHRAFNALDAKAIHQQEVAKFLLTYTNASRGDAERIVNAYDNQSTMQENGAVAGTHIGGASPGTVAMADKQKADFSYAAGNLEQYAGLSQQADTLGQERLLRGATNEMLEDMGGYAYQFVRGIGKDIFWFDIRDPDPSAQPIKKKIPGSDIEYEVQWTPEKRQRISELEFEIDVEPYSYVERSPDSRLADLLGAVQMYLSMADQAMAQGITLDVDRLFSHIAKMKNSPELNECLIRNQNPEELTSLTGGSQQRTSEAGGPRRYIRESRSDGSGENTARMQAMTKAQNPQAPVQQVA